MAKALQKQTDANIKYVLTVGKWKNNLLKIDVIFLEPKKKSDSAKMLKA